MFTVDTVIDNLKKFDIDAVTLREWEEDLALEVPMDEYGRKQYSPHHVNLFKNIKKHLTLGRTIEQIRELIKLPPQEISRPVSVQQVQSQIGPNRPTKSHPRPLNKNYASSPMTTPDGGGSGGRNHTELVPLIEKLMAEKDKLQGKQLAMERLNTHLYNTNEVFHRKVKELTDEIQRLKSEVNDKDHHEQIKLMDDKAKLHLQLLESEKLNQKRSKELDNLTQELKIVSAQKAAMEEQVKKELDGFDTKRFCGDWQETGALSEVIYDNFGINIDHQRNRKFRIPEVPEHTYNKTTILSVQYEYESNTLWKRYETLVLSHINDDLLKGQLHAEYIIDGIPVAKAIYEIQCERIHAIKTEVPVT